MSNYVPNFRGEKLTEGREARGLTQTGLADLIGLSSSQVSKYEKGEQSPSPSSFENIYIKLNIPPKFFLTERKRAIDYNSPYFYRSVQSKTKIQRLRARAKFIWVQDIYSLMWSAVEFPPVNIPKIYVPENLNDIDADFIEHAAQSVRDAWGLSDGPISNITRLLENNGIVVATYDFDCNEIEAFSQMSFDKPHIIFGSHRRSACGIRFSVAHELGHIILHRHLSQDMLDDKKLFKQIENQAHHFARAFIFPKRAFLHEIGKPCIDTFRVLKHRWKMAISAMIYRAEDIDDMLLPGEAKKMRISISRRGWRTDEPLDEEISIESPELMKDAVEMTIREGLYTRKGILDALKLPQKDIEELTSLPFGFFNDNLVELKPRRVAIQREEPNQSCPNTSNVLRPEAFNNSHL